MTELLVLTMAERRAAWTAAASAIAVGWKDEFVVNDILAAINNVRFGDPLGTVRRTGVGYATRVEHEGKRRWRAVSIADGETWIVDDESTINRHNIVYTPE